MKNAIPLTDVNQLAEIDDISNKPHIAGVLIFKHSTRCAVSHFALKAFEKDWKYTVQEFPVYFLDLLKYRQISNAVAEKFEVKHESPQILLIKNASCIGNASHNLVSVNQVEAWRHA